MTSSWEDLDVGEAVRTPQPQQKAADAPPQSSDRAVGDRRNWGQGGQGRKKIPWMARNSQLGGQRRARPWRGARETSSSLVVSEGYARLRTIRARGVLPQPSPAA